MGNTLAPQSQTPPATNTSTSIYKCVHTSLCMSACRCVLVAAYLPVCESTSECMHCSGLSEGAGPGEAQNLRSVLKPCNSPWTRPICCPERPQSCPIPSAQTTEPSSRGAGALSSQGCCKGCQKIENPLSHSSHKGRHPDPPQVGVQGPLEPLPPAT